MKDQLQNCGYEPGNESRGSRFQPMGDVEGILQSAGKFKILLRRVAEKLGKEK